MSFRRSEAPITAAAKAGFSASTGYRFEQDTRLPSQKKVARGRRRPDPLAAVWDSEIAPMLQNTAGLRAVAVFDEIRHRHPEISAGVRRTLERRIRAWRALTVPSGTSSSGKSRSRAVSVCPTSPIWPILAW